MVLVSVTSELLEAWVGVFSEQTKIPKLFSVRAVDVAFYLTIRCLSCSLDPNKSFFELFYGR